MGPGRCSAGPHTFTGQQLYGRPMSGAGEVVSSRALPCPGEAAQERDDNEKNDGDVDDNQDGDL